VNETSSSPSSEHAVVIGGSVAGLLAARALSSSFDRVTVFDRDTLPSSPAPRRGVPQGRQVHALLVRGAEGLERLFPGFLDDMAAAGAPSADGQADFSWYLDGHKMAGAVSGLRGYGVSRPLIEALIRDRVAALPNVTIADRTEVTGFLSTSGRIAGVHVQGESAGASQPVPAALVIDAAGRGSRALTWLRELGHPLPAESVVRADVVYVTRHFKQGPGVLEGRMGATVVPFPGQPRAGVVIRQEADQFALLLAGLLGEEPPTNDRGMADFAASLAGHEIADVLRAATPVDEPAKMRHPESTLRHFAELGSRPDGFLVVGDALCNFNPIYGQGMTVAVMEAELLQSLLTEGRDGLPARFFPAVADLLVEPWSLATGGDLRFPEVEGERGPQDEEINGYLTQVRAAAAVDPAVGTAFLRVVNMVAPVASLFSPELAERTQRAVVLGRRGAGEAAADGYDLDLGAVRRGVNGGERQGLLGLQLYPRGRLALAEQRLKGQRDGDRGPRLNWAGLVDLAGDGDRGVEGHRVPDQRAAVGRAQGELREAGAVQFPLVDVAPGGL
jgi:2-polyprenyl-6-methoxyphenol hydroxylase-like FAD-dependent oxidoreductase